MKDLWIPLLLISIAVAQQEIDDPDCFRFTWLGSRFNANSTYLDATCDEVTKGASVPCTRPLVAIVTVESEGAAKSGCYSEYQDGREIEVCVCRSTPGGMPCNTGGNKSYFRLSIVYVLLFNIFLFNIL